MEIEVKRQTIITPIKECLDYQNESEFIQTPHDLAVEECIDSLKAEKHTPLNMIPHVTNDFLVTIIMYTESPQSQILQIVPNPNAPQLQV
jgi:hypothetical protein